MLNMLFENNYNFNIIVHYNYTIYHCMTFYKCK